VPTNTGKLLTLAGNKPALVVLNAVPAQGNRQEQARQALDQMGMHVCPHTIGARASFGDAGALGQTPEEYDPGRVPERFGYSDLKEAVLERLCDGFWIAEGMRNGEGNEK
jgi:hypothetical protein